MDALTVLRRFTAAGRAPVLEGDEYVFDDVRFPRASPTTYKRQAGGHYTLEALVFFVESKGLGVGAYMRAARERKVQAVSALDKANLLSYLLGKTETSASIDRSGEQDAKRRRLDGSSATVGGVAAGNDVGAAEAGAAASSKAAKAPFSAPAPVPPAAQVARKAKSKFDQVLDRETRIRDRNNILLSSKSFQAILQWEKNLKKGGAAPLLPDEGGDVDAAKAAAALAASSAPKRSFGVPIIVVPSAVTSVITLYNVKEFLEKGVFRSTAELRKAGVRKQHEVLVERAHPTLGMIRYKVVDTVNKFKPRHWDRVVAVFAAGPAWQFKGWAWPSPVEIFSRCQGLHLYFDDAKIADTIRSWSVKSFALKKQTRNSDRVQCHGIWKVIDSWMVIHAPTLLPAVRRDNEDEDDD